LAPTGQNVQVGIGTSSVPKAYTLGVNGKVICGEVFVQNYSAWQFPDYVFEPSYKLPSLESVAKYIKENKHLPNVPSAKEIERDGGISIGQMNLILLQKVEEMTLYILEQERRIKQLEEKMGTANGTASK
jgi:hypothetical protein